jgi:hypothetical protein
VAEYCAIADVEGVLPQGVKIDNQTSEKPTRAVVLTWIPRVSGRVTVALRRGNYTVPVTDSDTLDALKGLVARKLAFDVMVTRGQRDDTKSPPLWIRWDKEFSDALEAMAEGTFDAPTGSGSLPWSPTMDADHETSDDSKNPKIHEGLDL